MSDNNKLLSVWQKYKIIILGILILLIGLVYAVIFEKNKITDQEFIVEEAEQEKIEETKYPTKTEVKKIVFHLDGAVNHPGVYSITENSYLYEAIKMAGGAKNNANLKEINLAEKIVDGQKIFIPFKENINTIKENKIENVNKQDNKSLNINQASIDDLKQIEGIGQKTAENIVNYRNKNGSFNNIEQLKEIKCAKNS